MSMFSDLATIIPDLPINNPVEKTTEEPNMATAQPVTVNFNQSAPVKTEPAKVAANEQRRFTIANDEDRMKAAFMIRTAFRHLMEAKSNGQKPLSHAPTAMFLMSVGSQAEAAGDAAWQTLSEKQLASGANAVWRNQEALGIQFGEDVAPTEAKPKQKTTKSKGKKSGAHFNRQTVESAIDSNLAANVEFLTRLLDDGLDMDDYPEESEAVDMLIASIEALKPFLREHRDSIVAIMND